MIGKTISHYKILEKLGEGGMGVVYKAQDTKLDRLVALKFLPRNLSASDQDKARFLQEAKAAAALNHPNICTIYGIEEHDDPKGAGEQFIIMEFVDGKTLRTHIAHPTSPLPFNQVVDWASQIGEALSAAHEKEITHRDIKPDNIMVNSKNQIKVMDFGLAKLKGGMGLTRSQSTLGTTAYMSPEQMQSADVDHRTDIWSFGVVLYEMLTGRLPFRGEHQAAMVYSITNEDAQPILSFRHDVPYSLQVVLAKALEKDRSRRYENVLQFLADLRQPQTTISIRKQEKSIAVLPLTNMSASADDEYFSDGMTEDIIAQLSKIRGLRVISRTSIMLYKQTKKSLHEIASELHVSHLLEGSVRKSGNRLRIVTQLIEVQTDEHLWSETYDRDLTDVFAIQGEVAQRVADALRIRLVASEKQQIEKKATQDLEAYGLFLKGRHFWNKRTQDGLSKAMGYFQQSIDLDPLYAAAYAGLADTYTILALLEFLPPRDAFPKARAMAEKAIEIDDTMAEVHASLGVVKFQYDWDWEGAEREFKQAIELNPNYGTAHHFYADYLKARGRFDEALSEIRQAQEFDPLSLAINTGVGHVLYLSRQYDQAIEQYRKTVELDPNFLPARLWFGRPYLQKGMYKEAIRELKIAAQLSPNSIIPSAMLGHACAASGDKEEALKILDDLRKRAGRQYVPSYWIGMIYVGLGDKENAIASFQKAYEERSSWLAWINVEPRFDSLRSDPRFEEIVRKMGLGRPVPVQIKKQKSDSLKPTVADSTPPEKSIVVLPFENNSPDKEDEYFSDGLTEEIITDLSKIHSLRVISRSSAMKLKGTTKDVKTLGRELNVRYVLEGSVRKAKDTLRITAELVDTATDTQLWAERYPGTLEDVFDIQEKVAGEIVKALKIELTTPESEDLKKRYTENAEAYELYLRGRFHWNKRTEEGFRKAVEHFQEAIEKDPTYALAYTGLADAYALLGDVGVVAIPPKEAFSKAKDAIIKALEIDRSLAEAHASLAHIRMHDFNWSDAEREFKQALELNPNYATTHHWYAMYLSLRGRAKEAMTEMKRAEQLDPISLAIHTDVGILYYYARQYDQAIVEYRKTIEMDPNFVRARITLASALVQKKMFDESITVLQKVITSSGDRTRIAALGRVYAASGKKEEATKIIEELKDLSKERYISPYSIGLVYAAMGNNDRAFEWLQRAYEESAADVIFLKVDPWLDNLHSDTRFTTLLNKMGLAG